MDKRMNEVEQAPHQPHELDGRIPNNPSPKNIDDFIAIRRREQADAQELFALIVTLAFAAFVAYLIRLVI
jgi:hypothetical protein